MSADPASPYYGPALVGALEHAEDERSRTRRKRRPLTPQQEAHRAVMARWADERAGRALAARERGGGVVTYEIIADGGIKANGLGHAPAPRAEAAS